jgi:predicted RNase H-like nuclease
MIAVGLDGYRQGWVAVRIEGAAHELLFLKTAADLLTMAFDRAAIDMPIGLPDRGLRACDLAARAMLRPHASRVFTGVQRNLWNYPSHADAVRALRLRNEMGISIQLWNLLPKIREVDAIMTPRRQASIREAHPELVFARLNGGVPLPSKRSAEGVAIRCALLRHQGFSAIADWLTVARIDKGARPDDVLDACAVALAARDFDQGFCLPAAEMATDAKGLAMQIWY